LQVQDLKVSKTQRKFVPKWQLFFRSRFAPVLSVLEVSLPNIAVLELRTDHWVPMTSCLRRFFSKLLDPNEDILTETSRHQNIHPECERLHVRVHVEWTNVRAIYTRSHVFACMVVVNLVCMYYWLQWSWLLVPVLRAVWCVGISERSLLKPVEAQLEYGWVSSLVNTALYNTLFNPIFVHPELG
jgi:hypothetical protein